MPKRPKILVYERGCWLPFSQVLAETGADVLLFTEFREVANVSRNALVGRDVPGIERVDSFWKHIDDVDVIAFPDIGDGDLQTWLRGRGYAVWGCGDADMLENDRLEFKRLLEANGMAVGPYKHVVGLDELEKELRAHDERYVKTSYWRGDLETYHHINWGMSKPWFDDLTHRLGPQADFMEFIVEEPIKAVELGYDGFCIKGQFPDQGMYGLELKDCYDDQTEILTDEGWKFFKDLSGSEEVLTLNTSDPRHYKIEYQQPQHYIRDPYKGPMLQIQNRNIDLLVTPNHNLFVQQNLQDPTRKTLTWKALDGKSYSFKQGKHKLGLVKANQINLTKPFSMPVPSSAMFGSKEKGKRRTFSFAGLSMRSATFARFLGLYLSEGSVAKGYITVSQEKYIHAFSELLTPLGFKRVSVGFGLGNKPLAEYLRQFGKAGDKYVPQWIKDSSHSLIRQFLHCYCLGDGSWMKNKKNSGTRRFTTKSLRMANDLQELLLKIGSVGIITKRKGREIYDVSERVVNRKNYVLPGHAKWIEYDGEIFCVTVPNHIIMVRRNGKPIWSGNCAYLGCSSGWSDLPQCLRETNEGVSEALGTLGMQGSFSTEVRIAEDGTFYFTDPTCRMPSPPMGAMSKLILNWADIVVAGAKGQVCEPQFAATWACEIEMQTPALLEDFVALDIPEECVDWVRLRRACMVDGTYWCIPHPWLDIVGSAVGIGETKEEAIDRALAVAEQVQGYQLYYNHHIREELLDGWTDAAKACGIEDE